MVFRSVVRFVSSRSAQIINQMEEKTKIVKIPRQAKQGFNACVDIGKEAITRKGGVVAIPTDTIYGIAGCAQNIESVERIYAIKNRNYGKPLAICVGDIEDIFRWCNVNVSNEMLSDLLPGPVTLVFERTKELNPNLNPDTDLVGVRIPDHHFIRGLARAAGPLALTSANMSSAQSTLDIEEFQMLWPKLDVIFDGGRISDTIESRLGSTVVDLSESGHFRIVREGCAYENTVGILGEKYGLSEVES